MNIKTVISYFSFVCILNAVPQSALAYTCEGYKSDIPVTIKLLSKGFDTIDGAKFPMGTFLLENHGQTTITLEGWREHGYLDIWYPLIVTLYYSKNGDVHEPNYGVVDSLPTQDKLQIKPGQTATFRTNIETDNQKGNSTYQARIVYVYNPQKICIYSDPFPLISPKS